MFTIPGRIPISIHPLFWLSAAFIGFLSSESFKGTLLWIVIVFLSVLIHELGHAYTALIFGKKPRIQLVLFGGITSFDVKGLSFWKQFLIAFDGPLFGFGLALLSTFILKLGFFEHPLGIYFFNTLRIVNLFWTLVNLLPVQPLDGGQLLRIALEGFLGIKGFKISLLIGMIISFAASLFFFLMKNFLIGSIFFLFAYQSFDLWKKSRFMTRQDRDEEISELLKLAEEAYSTRNFAAAKQLFEKIRKKTKKGLLFAAATHDLAFIDAEEGNRKEAYSLFLSVKDELEDEAICLFQELCYEEGNFLEAAKLATNCFQLKEDPEIALRNAKVFAILKDPKTSGGWLYTALREGKMDREKILLDPVFDPVRSHRDFHHFLEKQ